MPSEVKFCISIFVQCHMAGLKILKMPLSEVFLCGFGFRVQTTGYG
jgi:hypothetical protein